MNKKISADTAKHILEIITVHPDSWELSEQDDNSFQFNHRQSQVRIYTWVLDDTDQVFVKLINGNNSREVELVFPDLELMKLPFITFTYVYANPDEGLVRESITFSDKGKVTNIDSYFRESGKVVKKAEMQMLEIWYSRLAMQKEYILAPIESFKATLENFLIKDSYSVFIARFKNRHELIRM